QMSFVHKIRIYCGILLGVFFRSLDADAQVGKGSVTAVVVDQATGEPVGFASAALFTQGSNTYVQGMQTVDDGKVLFSDLAAGVYTLRITYVGYKDHVTEDVSVVAGQRVELGNIPLERSGELLEEVVVQGAPPAMELGIDRKIFNV